MHGRVGLRAAVALCVCMPAFAQSPPREAVARPTAREDALDPKPIDPDIDPAVGLFLNDWRDARPRTGFGRLVYRDILTRLDSADPLRPAKPGAVLSAITAVSRATLAPRATATGRIAVGERQIFYTVGGTGALSVNGKRHAIADGVGFTLTPDFDFTLTNNGAAPLAFYVRTEPLPPGTGPDPDVTIVSRWDLDRRVGAHWVHICNGGPAGMTLCTIAPHTMPQPHSHAGEEAWLLVKGDSILSLGKTLVRMHPGQAYKIPPNGLVAHSNLNLADEPIQLLYMGPAVRVPGPAPLDFARLDNSPIAPATAPDVDMFMGNWRDAYPRIAHGNLYMRDMLTALQGPDALHPTRKGAVLVRAVAVSQAMLEPGSTAHHVDGEMKGVQETFVVRSGTGFIESAGRRVALSEGMAFIVTPGLDFRLTAKGGGYMTFYVVTENRPDVPSGGDRLTVVDHRSAPATLTDWSDGERPMVTKDDGLSRYGAISHVTLKPMAMARPTSAAGGAEEIWIALDDGEMLFGKQLRQVAAGTAYKIPATGITAHANINVTNRPAEFLVIR